MAQEKNDYEEPDDNTGVTVTGDGNGEEDTGDEGDTGEGVGDGGDGGETPFEPPSTGGGGGSGVIDIGSGNVPEAGEGPGAFESSGTGNDPTPTEWDVTREQTVKGQLEDVYDRDSPFMERAAERTERRHLAGGGQNSLMARKAGQEAAMDTAFKVAFADAAIYGRSAEFNAAMKNQFGLAEQRFIQNSLLSDQNYKQSVELQTQMIAGQLEGIRMEYMGRGKLADKEFGFKNALLDKEFRQFFAKATYEAELKEYAEMTGFQRQVTLQGMISNGAFLVHGFDSVMQYANNPNFTPEQSAAAARSGMGFLREGFDINEAFWASVGAGGDTGDVSMPEQPFGGSYPWWDYSGG